MNHETHKDGHTYCSKCGEWLGGNPKKIRTQTKTMPKRGAYRRRRELIRGDEAVARDHQREQHRLNKWDAATIAAIDQGFREFFASRDMEPPKITRRAPIAAGDDWREAERAAMREEHRKQKRKGKRLDPDRFRKKRKQNKRTGSE